jgi:hypothetical protein
MSPSLQKANGNDIKAHLAPSSYIRSHLSGLNWLTDEDPSELSSLDAGVKDCLKPASRMVFRIPCLVPAEKSCERNMYEIPLELSRLGFLGTGAKALADKNCNITTEAAIETANLGNSKGLPIKILTFVSGEHGIPDPIALACQWRRARRTGS